MKTIIQQSIFEEKFTPRRRLKFSFYEDGSLDIVNTINQEPVALHSLNKESKAFYVQQRIAYIRAKLLKVRAEKM